MSRDPEPVDEPVDDPVDDAIDDAADDALHWAGDEQRGQAAPRLGGAGAASATPVDETGDELEPAPRRTPAERALRAGTVAFGLVYLAHSIGWIFSAQLLIYPGLDLLGEIMWQFGEFLSMVAPAMWFAAALTLTPEGARHRGVARMLGLLVGALALVPWPPLLYWIGSMS